MNKEITKKRTRQFSSEAEDAVARDKVDFLVLFFKGPFFFLAFFPTVFRFVLFCLTISSRCLFYFIFGNTDFSS